LAILSPLGVAAIAVVIEIAKFFVGRPITSQIDMLAAGDFLFFSGSKAHDQTLAIPQLNVVIPEQALGLGNGLIVVDGREGLRL
jgi:hypothetical protein